MTSVGLSIVGACLALVGLILSSGDAARARRAAAACLVVLVATGAFIAAAPAGLGKSAIVATAHGPDALPVASSVTFQREDGSRSVRRVTLEKPLPAAAPMLWFTAGVALLFVLIAETRAGQGPLGRLGGPAAAAMAGLSGVVLAGGVGGMTGAGEAEVRVVLAALGLEPLGVPTAFTVPDAPWSYRAGQPLALYVAAGLAFLISFLPEGRRAIGGLLLFAGAALAAAAPAIDIALIGGLAWRPATGLLWGAGLLAAGAVFDREASARAGTLAGLAAGLATLQLALL